MKKTISIFILVIFFIFQFTIKNMAYAEKLGDFKKDVPKTNSKKEKSSEDTGSCLNFLELIEAMYNITLLGITIEDNFIKSEQEYENMDKENIRFHTIFGVDTQYINSNIYGYSIYGRLSIFTLGVDMEFLQYNEDLNPGHDKLNILNANFGYNLYSERLNVFIGVGVKSFGDAGLDSASQFALKVDGRLFFEPLRYEGGINFGNVQHTAIHDYKLGLAWKIKNFSIKSGYRTIFLQNKNSVSPDISGPYIGLMYNF